MALIWRDFDEPWGRILAGNRGRSVHHRKDGGDTAKIKWGKMYNAVSITVSLTWYFIGFNFVLFAEFVPIRSIHIVTNIMTEIQVA